MATIVQPYNPWREQLLANFLGPIVGNMIQSSQQNAQNKKYNAMLGELAKAGQPQQAVQAVPSLLAGLQDTQTNDGWVNAFRQGGNELANYDANTAVTPQVTPSPVNQYNQADMMRNYMQIMANPRFSSLNPDTAYKLATPFLQALQAQRMTDMRSQYARDFMNAGSFDDQMRYLAGGGIEGAVTPELINSYRPYAEHRQPHMTFAEMDAGDQKYRLAQNPATGQVTPVFSANVGVSPNTLATTATQRYIADQTAGLEQQRINIADRAQNLEEAKHQHLMFQPSYSDREKAIVEQMNKDYTALGNQENALREQMLNETDPKVKSDLNTQIRGIQQQREQLRSAIYSRLAGPQQTQQMQQQQGQINSSDNNSLSLGSRLLGNANKGRVSHNGHFGADRKTHLHGGADYPAPLGTPIKIDAAMGDNLRVVHVDTDPNNPSNYGCHIRLEGEKNGQKYGFIMSHMQENSITVKPGQTVNAGFLVGKVGSTGRSSGPHLHLEVHRGGLGGKKINPEKFLQGEGRQQTRQQAPQVMPQPTQDSQTDNPVAWRHGKDSNYTMTQEQYENAVKKAEAGEFENAHSRGEVDKVLQDNGYIRESQAPQVMPQPEQQDQTPRWQQMPDSPVAWIHGEDNNDKMTVAEYNYFLREAQAGKIEDIHTREQADRYLEKKGYIRQKRELTPEMDMRPSWQKTNAPQAMTGTPSVTPVPEAQQPNTPSVTPQHPDETPDSTQAQLDKLNGEEKKQTRQIDFNALWRGH